MARFLRIPLVIAATALGLAWPLAAAAQASSLPPPVAWTFGGAQGAGGWAAERGSMTAGEGGMRLQPDANRRVVLVSPPSLPGGVEYAREFVLGIGGTGLVRVRVQGRRDARGGWITLADARGSALRNTPEGIAVTRNPVKAAAPIERLRIELEFRTTNPRTLERIVARPLAS